MPRSGDEIEVASKQGNLAGDIHDLEEIMALVTQINYYSGNLR